MQVSENLVLISTTDLQNIVENAVSSTLQKHFPQLNEPFSSYPEILTRNEVCEMLQISLATLTNWCKEGRLKASKQGKVVRFYKKDVLELLRSTPKHKRI